MNRWINQVALVTGSSSGIGEDIAEKLVEEGLKVVGVARRKEKLEELAKRVSSKKGKFYPFQADVSKEEDILKAFKWTKENVGPVSILINNAGITRNALLSESATSNWTDVLNVNVLGPCIAAREAIKHMKENNIDGHIIYINSVLGHKIVPIIDFNMYTPSKHAITAIATTLRLELAALKSKIKVTSLSPGFVQTEMVSNFPKHPNPEIAEKMKNASCLKTEDIANAVKFVLSTPKHVQSISPGAVKTEFISSSPNKPTPEEAEYIKKMPQLKTEDVSNAIIFALSTPKHVQITELTIQALGEMA